MKATLHGNVSRTATTPFRSRGYDYFPLAAVRTDLLEKSAADREGPRMPARRAVL